MPTSSTAESARSHPGPGRQLGIASHIYVISLLERQDRRAPMGRLRAALDLTWTVVDATPFTDPLIYRLLDWVAFQRKRAPLLGGDGEEECPSMDAKRNGESFQFRWPCDIDAHSVLTHTPLPPSESEMWVTQFPPLPESMQHSSPSAPPPLLSAVDDYAMPTGVLRDVHWMRLTPPRVACWHSHVRAIRTFVDNDNGSARPDDVGIFLEDDVDMERDIARRLAELWKALPSGWDIVLLGHAWSNEATYPPLPLQAPVDFATRVHPSYHPRCTHAYALSLVGARRLLQHLRYPPFAYSRALDHAFAWLIESGRLRSCSIVPSVVVQRKDTPSDILPGTGSERTACLEDGVLGS